MIKKEANRQPVKGDKEIFHYRCIMTNCKDKNITKILSKELSSTIPKSTSDKNNRTPVKIFLAIHGHFVPLRVWITTLLSYNVILCEEWVLPTFDRTSSESDYVDEQPSDLVQILLGKNYSLIASTESDTNTSETSFSEHDDLKGAEDDAPLSELDLQRQHYIAAMVDQTIEALSKEYKNIDNDTSLIQDVSITQKVITTVLNSDILEWTAIKEEECTDTSSEGCNRIGYMIALLDNAPFTDIQKRILSSVITVSSAINCLSFMEQDPESSTDSCGDPIRYMHLLYKGK